MAEWVVLDPEEVAEDRVELDITPFVNKEGIDWGDAAIEAYMAEAARGQVPVDFRIPNRQVEIPLLLLDRAELDDDNANNFDAIRSAVQAKVSLFQREGGWVKRSVAGDPVYAEVVSAALKLGGGTAQAISSIDPDAVLTLELVPDFVADEGEVTEEAASSEVSGEIVALLENIEGHYPARTRIVVTEEAAAAQLGLLYALRSRHYSAAPSAACAFAAQDLTPLDTAANATVASEPVVRHQNLSTAWTPILGLDDLTHTGTNRLWAVVYSTSATPPRLRSVYDVGDMVLPEDNDPVSIPGASNFYLVDLGELRLDRGPVGDHKWAGQIQAQGAAGGENVSILRVYVLNCDEGYGIVRASLSGAAGLADFVARDEFNQTVGGGSDPLTGLTLPVGGTWTVVAGSDADDFVVEDIGHTAQRTAVSDAVPRMVAAGTADYAAIAGRCDLRANVITADLQGGVLLRAVDDDNYVMAGTVQDAENVVGVVVKVAGNAETFTTPYTPVADVWYTAQIVIDTAGHWAFWFFRRGGTAGVPLLQGHHSELATGGDLEEGMVGLHDLFISAAATTRSYDNPAFWVPDLDAVLNPGRSLEIRTEGTFREIAAGTDWGPTQPPYGDLPRLPPSGLEDRPCEVFLLASSGDLAELPHAAGDITARVYSRASYLTAPPGPPFPSETTIPSEDLFPGP